MRKFLYILLFFAAFSLSFETRPAFSQTLDLTLSVATISFPDANPITTPSLPANTTVGVTARVRSNAGNNWILTHLAAGDLSPSIPVSNITWTVTPAPFIGGTMSRLAAQTAASGTGNLNPAVTGTFTFRIANLWSYNTGVFSVATTFTLTAP